MPVQKQLNQLAVLTSLFMMPYNNELDIAAEEVYSSVQPDIQDASMVCPQSHRPTLSLESH